MSLHRSHPSAEELRYDVDATEGSGKLGRKPCVVLLHGDSAWVDGVAELLSDAGFPDVVCPKDEASALRSLRKQDADVFIAEIGLDADGVTGLDVIQSALARLPELNVIAVIETRDSNAIGQALRAGAQACVIKSAQAQDILLAVRQLLEPTIYFAHDLQRKLDWEVVGRTAVYKAGLHRRELEILQLVAKGATNSEVARQLWVSEQTVKFHLNSIYKKLGVASRTQASHWAHRHGLVRQAPPGDI
jgi:NarL family two-component system response regulator LiaR